MDWLKDRLAERTSADGMICIAVGASIVILGPLGKLLALALIGYGMWTFWKSE